MARLGYLSRGARVPSYATDFWASQSSFSICSTTRARDAITTGQWPASAADVETERARPSSPIS